MSHITKNYRSSYLAFLTIALLVLASNTVSSIVIVGGTGSGVTVTSTTNGTLTSISPGNGITTSPNPLTATGTVSQDFAYSGIYTALWNHYAGIALADLNISTSLIVNVPRIASLDNKTSVSCKNITGGTDPDFCVDSGGGSGTVTSVTCGTGLNGGTFTDSGTCSVDFPSFTNTHNHDANNITTGTLGDVRLSTNITFLPFQNVFTGLWNLFRNINATTLNASRINVNGGGINTTGLNASNVNSSGFISGNLTPPQATGRGGIYDTDCTANQFVNGVANDGTLNCATPTSTTSTQEEKITLLGAPAANTGTVWTNQAAGTLEWLNGNTTRIYQNLTGFKEFRLTTTILAAGSTDSNFTIQMSMNGTVGEWKFANTSTGAGLLRANVVGFKDTGWVGIMNEFIDPTKDTHIRFVGNVTTASTGDPALGLTMLYLR